jgi:hypothetical protein
MKLRVRRQLLHANRGVVILLQRIQEHGIRDEEVPAFPDNKSHVSTIAITSTQKDSRICSKAVSTTVVWFMALLHEESAETASNNEDGAQL